MRERVSQRHGALEGRKLLFLIVRKALVGIELLLAAVLRQILNTWDLSPRSDDAEGGGVGSCWENVRIGGVDAFEGNAGIFDDGIHAKNTINHAAPGGAGNNNVVARRYAISRRHRKNRLFGFGNLSRVNFRAHLATDENLRTVRKVHKLLLFFVETNRKSNRDHIPRLMFLNWPHFCALIDVAMLQHSTIVKEFGNIGRGAAGRIGAVTWRENNGDLDDADIRLTFPIQGKEYRIGLHIVEF
ncbi:hypothetical protein F414_gp07 [Cronobacter phage ESP2949-1]|uniref:Uncharacterized protein n=1 Tax=Cronobacter phage ESP2949-1 TaxID=2920894 RepID=G1CSQ4_9CAUD|nr:hypothetical protein F414_gp07 [Cronobacter phage ESP2949-1]AEM24782.1 hypothetical protein [Cronobacter phage ESP2949-1]